MGSSASIRRGAQNRSFPRVVFEMFNAKNPAKIAEFRFKNRTVRTPVVYATFNALDAVMVEYRVPPSDVFITYRFKRKFFLLPWVAKILKNLAKLPRERETTTRAIRDVVQLPAPGAARIDFSELFVVSSRVVPRPQSSTKSRNRGQSKGEKSRIRTATGERN